MMLSSADDLVVCGPCCGLALKPKEAVHVILRNWKGKHEFASKNG
jgi:hypothetical protein